MPILSSLAVACARAYGFTALSGNFVTVIQSFTATGEWVCPTGVTEVEYLVVAGGVLVVRHFQDGAVVAAQAVTVQRQDFL
jgi:hypothetical protein